MEILRRLGFRDVVALDWTVRRSLKFWNKHKFQYGCQVLTNVVRVRK